MFKKLLALFAAMTVAVAVAFAAPKIVEVVNASVNSLRVHPSIDANLATLIIKERNSGKGPYKNWDDLIARVPAFGGGKAAKFSAEGLRVNNVAYVPPPPRPTPAEVEKARVAEELRLQKERQVAEANRAAAKVAAEAAAAKARAALEAENKAKAEKARVEELRNQAANQAAAAADRKRQAEEDAVDQKRKAFRDAQDKEKAAKYAADTKNLDVCGKNQMAYRYEEGKIADKKSDEIQEKVRAAEKEKMARDRQANIDYAPNPKFDKSANDSQANQLRLVLANNQKGAQDKIRALTNEQTNWTRLQEERIKKWMDDSRYNKKICP